MVLSRFGLYMLLVQFVFAINLVSLPFFAADASAEESMAALKKPLTIDASTMEVDNKGGKVVFKGDVEAREAFILCSDELHIRYTEAREIQDITAIGNVRLLQDGKTARAGRAYFDKLGGTIVLTKNPSITQCDDMVSGSKITFDLDSEIALIDGGNGGRVRAVIMPEKDCLGEDDIEADFCKRTR